MAKELVGFGDEPGFGLSGQQIVYKALVEEGRVKQLSRFFRDGLSGLKILEVGSGMGILADILKNKGADYNGIEPSSHIYEMAIKRHPQLKGDIKNTGVMNLEFRSDYFDVILMVDTFEHLPDPLNYLRILKKFLKKSGILYIEVPNEGLLKIKGWLRIKLNLYGGYPTYPSHTSLFTKKTLSKMIKSAGYELSVVSQAAIFGNKARLRLALGRNLPYWMHLACILFNITKLDLLLGQGNLVAVAARD